MRIHQIVSSALEVHGGPSLTVTTLCEELAALGHEVTLHTYEPPPTRRSSSYELRTYHWSRVARRLGLSRDMLGGLRAAAQSGAIMHVHGLWMLSNVWPAWAVRDTACKLVFAPRGMLDAWALSQRKWLKRSFWLACQRSAVRAADLLHVTADSELATVRALGLSAPAALIPNGVAIPTELDTAHFASSPRTLLFLSRLHPKKGLEPLIIAWSKIQREFPDWQLRIVGPGSDAYVASLLRIARDSNAERLVVVGPAYGSAKTTEFRGAQLFILPTYSENFGVGIAEALAHGVPAIAGRGAPWARLAREQCGYWIDNDIQSIVACLREVLPLSPAELQTLGARGRAWMIRDFAWRERAKEMVDAYSWLEDAGAAPSFIEAPSNRVRTR